MLSLLLLCQHVILQLDSEEAEGDEEEPDFYTEAPLPG